MAQASKQASLGRRLAIFAGAAALVVVLDQITKALVRSALTPGQPVCLIPHVMDLSLVYNTGAAFSVGEGKGLLFVVVCAVILAACLYEVVREKDMPAYLVACLGCVCGGGVGNAIDRVVEGRVTDFFATTFMDFAVFNVADIFITCGVIAAVVMWWHWDAVRAAAAEGASGVDASAADTGTDADVPDQKA